MGKTIQFIIAHCNLKKEFNFLETYCISSALDRSAVEIDIYQYKSMYELYKAIIRTNIISEGYYKYCCKIGKTVLNFKNHKY